MNLHPEIESAAPSEIIALQERKLKELLLYLQQCSPYYKKLFAEKSIDVSKIERIQDLQRIPPTTKDDLQRDNWDFLCIARNDVAEYTTTSGTLGKPLTIALSRSDINRLAYNEALSFACADGSASDVYQLMLTLDRQFMAGLAYYEGIRKLGAGLVRVGPGLPAMQWEVIQRVRPTAIVGVPSFIVHLLDYARQNGIDVRNSSVKKAVCIGESIRTSTFEWNALGSKINRDWGITLYGTYASTEMQTAFTECSNGNGGHLHPELLIVEALDENNNPVAPGTPGEITITTLGVEAMPLLRYKTGDIACIHTEACTCGRTTVRVGPVVGRRQQMLKVKGTTLYPPAIFDVLHAVDPLLHYVVEVHTNTLGTDELKIFIVSDDPSASKKLAAAFQATIRVVPEIVFVDSGTLERLQGIGANRKVRKFIDGRT